MGTTPVYYSYEAFREDIKTLLSKLDTRPDALVAITRGGLTMAHFISIALDMREVFTIGAASYGVDKKQHDVINIFNTPDLKDYKNVLIVDEIIDSGKSMQQVHKLLTSRYAETDFKVAALFYKKEAVFTPDYYVKEANGWIDFFWEVDILAT